MTFTYTSGNPDNLTAGHDASMRDIQGPFYDLRNYLNETDLLARIEALEARVAQLEGQP